MKLSDAYTTSQLVIDRGSRDAIDPALLVPIDRLSSVPLGVFIYKHLSIHTVGFFFFGFSAFLFFSTVRATLFTAVLSFFFSLTIISFYF